MSEALIEHPEPPPPPPLLEAACAAWERASDTRLCARAWLGEHCWRFDVYRRACPNEPWREAGRLFLYAGDGPGQPTAKWTRGGPGATAGLGLSAQEAAALQACRAALRGEVGL